MTLEFEEVRLCPHCESPAEERFIGDEGATFCSDGCGCLEGDICIVKFECPICHELCLEEKCNCQQIKARTTSDNMLVQLGFTDAIMQACSALPEDAHDLKLKLLALTPKPL